MTMLASLGSVFATFIVAHTACDVSNAGMMPSIWVHALNPLSASSSVAETYSPRLVSCSHACSGPTPG